MNGVTHDAPVVSHLQCCPLWKLPYSYHDVQGCLLWYFTSVYSTDLDTFSHGRSSFGKFYFVVDSDNISGFFVAENTDYMSQ